jgi:hypothetical protein
LRYGPATIEELADCLDAAEFSVRGELHALARMKPQLVYEGELGEWRLTDHGAWLVWSRESDD